MEPVIRAHAQLKEYIEQRDMMGIDPYDALNTSFTFLAERKWPAVLLIQFLKRSPINVRPILGIEKGVNPKALGLVLNAYALDYKRAPDEELRLKMDVLFDRIIALRSVGWDRCCWGYDFKWASPVKTLGRYAPTIVVSAFIAKGLRAYYEVTQKKEVLDTLISIGEFAEKDLPHHRDTHGLCVSYSTVVKDICHNASLLAGEVFAMLFVLTGKSSYRGLARDIAKFSVADQKENGSWAYSRKLESGSERLQVDFHQGYVLDSLKNISRDIETSEFNDAISRGIDFYKKEQFSVQGRSFWRLPRKWPTDIHHQAQGIISFSGGDQVFARKILKYTLKEFQSSDGAFYFRKYRLFKNKIKYMRWGQAWMLLAMSTYLSHGREG